MNFGFLKSAMKLMTTLGLDSMAFNLAKAVRPTNTNVVRKTCEIVAAMSTSAYIADKVNGYLDTKIDEVAEEIVKGIKKEDIVHESSSN